MGGKKKASHASQGKRSRRKRTGSNATPDGQKVEREEDEGQLQSEVERQHQRQPTLSASVSDENVAASVQQEEATDTTTSQRVTPLGTRSSTTTEVVSTPLSENSDREQRTPTSEAAPPSAHDVEANDHPNESIEDVSRLSQARVSPWLKTAATSSGPSSSVSNPMAPSTTLSATAPPFVSPPASTEHAHVDAQDEADVSPSAQSPAVETPQEQDPVDEETAEADEASLGPKSRQFSVASSHYVSSHEQLASGRSSPDTPHSSDQHSDSMPTAEDAAEDENGSILSEGQVDTRLHPDLIAEQSSLATAATSKDVMHHHPVEEDEQVFMSPRGPLVDDAVVDTIQHAQYENVNVDDKANRKLQDQFLDHDGDHNDDQRKTISQETTDHPDILLATNSAHSATRDTSPSLLDRLQAIMTAHHVTLPLTATSTADGSSIIENETTAEHGQSNRTPSSRSPSRSSIRRVRIHSSEDKKSILQKSNERLSQTAKPPFKPAGAISSSPSRALVDETSPSRSSIKSVVHQRSPTPHYRDGLQRVDIEVGGHAERSEKTERPALSKDVEAHGYDLREEYLRLRATLSETQQALQDAQLDAKANREALHRTSIHLQDERTMRHAAETQSDEMYKTVERYRSDQRIRDEEILALREDVTQLRAQVKQQETSGAGSSPKSTKELSDLQALQKEIAAQEMLINGFQMENEKLVMEMRELTRQRKANDANVTAKIAALQRELTSAKVQLQHQSGREHVAESSRLQDIKSEMEFILRSSAERESQLTREIKAQRGEVEILRQQIINMVDSNPGALQALKAEKEGLLTKIDALEVSQKEAKELQNTCLSQKQALAAKAKQVQTLQEQVKQLQAQSRRSSLKRPPLDSSATAKSSAQLASTTTTAPKDLLPEEEERAEHAKTVASLQQALEEANAEILRLSNQNAPESRSTLPTQRSSSIPVPSRKDKRRTGSDNSLGEGEAPAMAATAAAAAAATINALEKEVHRLKELNVAHLDAIRKGDERQAEMQDVHRRELTTLREALAQTQRRDSPVVTATTRGTSPSPHPVVLAEKDDIIKSLEANITSLEEARQSLEKDLAISNARAVAVHETTIALLQRSSETVSKTALAHSEQALQWLKEHEAHERGRFEQEELARYRTKLTEYEVAAQAARQQISAYEREMAKWRIGLADLGIAVRSDTERLDADGTEGLPFDAKGVRLRIDALREENDALQAALNVARSAHTPTMHHYEQLMSKFEKIEEMYRRRERAMREMIYLQQQPAGTRSDKTRNEREENLALKAEVQQWERRYSTLVENKEAEIMRFRKELDDVIDALQQLQQAP